MKLMRWSKIGFVLVAAFLGAVTGCVHHADPSRQVRGYPQPAPVYVDRIVVVQEEYVYYPGYEVYYSGHSRQYVYRDGRSWVSRPAPPRVSADVLFASPSVRVGFHDSPAAHHAAVVKQYPKNWAPPVANPNHDPGNQDDGKGKHRGETK